MGPIANYLTHYLKFFGDRCGLWEELYPFYDEFRAPTDHVGLEAKFSTISTPEQAAIDKYRHPCWCNPELIYADDVRGNEVWLHKPVQ